MNLSPGVVLADRYRLTSGIATGGMGEVWEALDTRLDRRVAVKVLKPEISADPEFLQRFRVEARTAAGLNHPGVAGVYDYGETSGVTGGGQATAYLVMELVEGEPLSAVFAREGAIDYGLALDVMEQTGRALQAAHARGIVHRDVKPGNILITPEGRVKITDFGIAKAVDAAPVTRTGMVMGTAQYIAPEQALGQEAGPASDVYALAVVGYEAVSGTRPFVGDNPLTVAMMHIRDVPPPLSPDVPSPIRDLLLSGLSKEPERRYGTGGEFADAVSAVRGGRRVPMPRGRAPGAPAPSTRVLGGTGPSTAAQAAPTARTSAQPTSAHPTRTGPLPGPATSAYAGDDTGNGPYPADGPVPVPPPTPARSRGTGWFVVIAVVVVAALATVIYLVLNGEPASEPAEQTTTSTEAPPTTTQAPEPTTDAPEPSTPEPTEAPPEPTEQAPQPPVVPEPPVQEPPTQAPQTTTPEQPSEPAEPTGTTEPPVETTADQPTSDESGDDGGDGGGEGVTPSTTAQGLPPSDPGRT